MSAAVRPLAPIALTMGDPAGVGGELTLMAWMRRKPLGPFFFALDDPGRLGTLARRLGLEIPIETIAEPAQANGVFPHALPVLRCALEHEARPGQGDPRNGPSVIASIRRAVEYAQSGAASAVVTNPIHKGVLYQAGFAFPGHTEFLADLAAIHTPPVMMLACPQLRVVPVTVHVALKTAVTALKTETIVTLSRITEQALRRDFNLSRPRLAVAALNPHAGENGTMGDEENTIIRPAIEILRGDGIAVSGPLSPDTMFGEEAREGYDAAICMYHDQALIPLKTLNFHGGVNITLGLPFVRTSPDHGTAFDIAGQGKANPTSFIAAIETAHTMTAHRAAAVGENIS